MVTGFEGVSVVSATWNEHERLPALIQRVRQTLRNTPHEIIIVDDNDFFLNTTLLQDRRYACLQLCEPIQVRY
jgi:hypothetical protein